MRRGTAALVIFAVIFAAYLASRVSTVWDSIWAIPTAVSILREGNTDLEEYSEAIAQNGPNGIEEIRGKRYNYFPIGASLAALPFVYVADRLDREHPPSATPYTWSVRHLGLMQKLVAAFLCAMAVALMFSLLRRTVSLPLSLLLTFVFAFGTSVWSVVSRGLWPHTLSLPLIALSLYLLVRAETEPRFAQFVSLPLVGALVARPTNEISLAVLSLYVLLRHRRQFVRYVLWGLPIAALFCAWSWQRGGTLVPGYYAPSRLGTEDSHLLVGLAGTLFSPARGLFVFCPIFLFCMVRRPRALEATLLAIVLLHWIAISSFVNWHGGNSYGPRLFAEVLPYLVYLLAPALERVVNLRGTLRWLALSGVTALLAFQVLVHSRGATDPRVWIWNDEPCQVTECPARLWDWTDLQFLHGLGTGSGS